MGRNETSTGNRSSCLRGVWIAVISFLAVGCYPPPTPLCPPLPAVLNTGWDQGTSTLYVFWDPDDDWYGHSSAWQGGALVTSNVVGVNPPYYQGSTVAGHFDTLPNSAWIKPISNALIHQWNFEIEFCLEPGFSNPQLDLDILARDGATLYLNGQLIGGPGAGGWFFPATHVATQNQSHFVAGTNVLQVVTANPNSDPNTMLDLAGEVTADVPIVDLSLVKTVDNPSPVPGDLITYTVDVTNDGPAVATAIFVRDLLPAGLTYSSHTNSLGAYDPVAALWLIPQLAVSATTSLSISAVVDAGTVGLTIQNQAEIIFCSQTDIDSVVANHVGTEDDQDAVGLTVQAPVPRIDLGITKDAILPFQYGAIASYKILVGNAGPDLAIAPLTVTDQLAAGLTYDQYTEPNGTNDWSCSAAGQMVTCDYNGPHVAAGGFLSVLRIWVNVADIDMWPQQSDEVDNCARTGHFSDYNPDNDIGCTGPIVVIP